MFDRKHWLLLFLGILLLLMILAIPVGGRRLREIYAPVERIFSGKVEAVSEHTCEICKWVEVSATLNTGPERLEIKLGPKAFLEERGFVLSRGDSIDITGIRFTERGKEGVLVNEVRKGIQKLVLRGKDGQPAWIGERGHLCPVCGN